MAWKNWPNYFFDTILNGLNISKKLNNSVILQSSLWFHLYILLRPFCSLVELSILGNPPQQPLRHWKFYSCVITSFRGSSRRRSRYGRSPSWATRISSLLVCGQLVQDFASVLRQPLGSHHRFICSHFWTGTLLLLLNICQLVSPFYIQDTRCKKRQSLSESWPSV